MARPTSLPAGNLWTRVTLQTLEPGPPDAYGSPELIPTEQGTVWADVEDLSGREVWYGQKVDSEITRGITIRIWDGGQRPRLTSSWQVVWQGLTHEIVSVVTDWTVGVQRLQCKELVLPDSA